MIRLLYFPHGSILNYILNYMWNPFYTERTEWNIVPAPNFPFSFFRHNAEDGS